MALAISRRSGLFKLLAIVSSVVVGGAVVYPASAFASSYTVAPNIVIAALDAMANPAAPPSGADITGCTSHTHPVPVILIDGTFANQEDDFGALAPTLANAGYCVYTFAYGAPASQYVQGLAHVPASAEQLAEFVAQVRSQTAAAKVDLIGHSQGGLLGEYYLKLLGGAPYIKDYIGLSPTTHGTTASGLLTLASFFPGANAFLGSLCQACVDQEVGSPVIRAVDHAPIAQRGVKYTVIETLNETVVTPVGSSFIDEVGVTNEYVQSYCPLDTVDHADLPYDQVVFQLVENALSPKTARAPNCWLEFPYPA